ncbi:TKL protein kinase [Saprolegnia parasitica CBS 223.65]|uniref:TKL protein kinase n=1 Tax=Saprolegnia parasitica (strain CBS 223.65) TaxID=695850 RepID=A0A067CW03_SAPPC|nr:TKL protein kinase [Saprolegnia parasitica CBS 223.65]KDO34894.1 TKL protein kinase [Saprolegnia parasitica CBS 223.65]|eukprot:XP_012194553.1 TKL protein kinase [Saprolegnia parasitica CBS 223.65]
METSSAMDACLSPFADYAKMDSDLHVFSLSQLQDGHVHSLSDLLAATTTYEAPATSQRPRCAPCSRIAENWDARILWFTLYTVLCLLVVSFAVPACMDATSYPLGTHLECMAPSPDLGHSKRQSYFDMVSIMLITGNVVVLIGVSLYLGLQCTWSKKKIMANPNHANLTNSFVLPCYALVWYIFAGLGASFIVGVTFSVSTALWVHPGFDAIYCFLFHFPITWIRQLLPVLMVQKSISKAAILRSVGLSGAMTIVFMSFIFIDKASDGVPIFFLGFHFVSLLYYAWTKYVCFARTSFDVVYVLLALTSVLYMLPPVVLLLDHQMHPSVFSRVTVVGNVVDAFTILSILLSLRADTKYWLGLDDNSVQTNDPAKLYLRLISDRGMVSSFSTRTSVYDVHYMIEEFKDSMIDYSCLHLDAVIAQGATAVVLRGSMHKHILRPNAAVAIKMYTSLFVTDDDVRRFSKETSLNIGLSHPNIVRFYGLCVVPPAICLVFEYCEWGSLELVLLAQNRSTTEWDLQTKLKACLDACRAVAYLHSFSPPLLHRDIKTANFLLASDAMLKLSDFGESNLMRPKNDGTMTVVGSVDFMAPEMISGGRPASAVYGTAADVYSLTMTLWHILAPGRNPWKGRSHFEVYTKTIQGERPPIPETLPTDCHELLERGWAPDADERWHADEMEELVLGMLKGGASCVRLEAPTASSSMSGTSGSYVLAHSTSM